MGLLDRLGLSRKRFDDFSQPSQIGILSPYADSTQLGTIVISEALGVALQSLPLGRSDAIKIPAVSKGRSLILQAVAKFPLRALTADGVLPADKQPTWLYRTNGMVSPYDRMAWTMDSLIFYGCALWVTSRGADDQILDAEWVPQDKWSVVGDNFYIEGRDEPLSDSEMILFNPPFEGLVNIANENLRGARDVEKSWQGRARNPIPVMVLKVTDDSNLTQDEVDSYVEAWSAARKSENGAVGFLPPGIDMETYGDISPDLMLQGRNATKTDIANYLNLPAALLDGTTAEASLTYVTTEGNRNLFYEMALPFWTDPIEARLSQDDIVPRGTRIRFDKFEEYAPTPSPTGAPMED